MSALKGIAVVAGVVAVGVGALLATGTIAVRRGDTTDPAASNPAQGDRTKEMDDLDSLAYVGAEKMRDADKNKVGVTINRAGQTWAGLNLYTPCGWGRDYRKGGGGTPLRESRLVDMHGKVLRTWKSDFLVGRSTRGWANAKLTEKGELYAVHARSGFLKFDWDGRQLWAIEGGYHHDFDFDANGNIYALVEERRTIPVGDDDLVIWDNGINVLSPTGEVLRTLWFYDALAGDPVFELRARQALAREQKKHAAAEAEKQGTPVAAPTSVDAEDPEDDEDDEDNHDNHDSAGNSPANGAKDANADTAPTLPPARKRKAHDLLHANDVSILDSSLAGKWDKGDILVAWRQLDVIAVIDPETGKVKWQWGKGHLDRPHDPDLIADNKILIFDNGMRRKWSRVIEYDPQSGAIGWSYRGNAEQPFFSRMRGLVQRLPNGNTLITESQSGRVFEVTSGGEIVWEFWGPDILKEDLRIPLRMNRLEGKVAEFAEDKLGLHFEHNETDSPRSRHAGKASADGGDEASKNAAPTEARPQAPAPG